MNVAEFRASARQQKSLAPIRLELKELGDDGAFTGYGSVFGVEDFYGDVVAPGAFRQSLADHRAKNSMPALLWQHDSAQPIGVWTDMAEDNIGLVCKGKLLTSVQKGAECYALMKAGAITGLSIGYSTIASTYNEQTDIRTLNQVDLWEVSAATFPANDLARVTGVKAMRAIKTIREFEDFLRDAGGFSHTAAKAIAAGGFKSQSQPRDEGELGSIAADGLDRLRRTLST